ncbi:MAG: sugar phosphate isomerase/epimerase family protein [Saprospiraceae bacterium]|jgi:sugar phosphate isomerase/epimerase|nr:sugar phosphate isomerase/epimerase [Saprospiraceae bacterium]MBP9745059.1 sugar phosphate isomerase/epimerase [Saprospiraceae bacterium]
MMRNGIFSKLCIHTITTKPWSIEEAITNYAAASIAGISVWRNTLEGRNIKAIGDQIRSHGLEVTSLARGGFFPSTDPAKRLLAIEDNLRAIDEAYALGAPIIVLVCGADPTQSLATSRLQIQDGLHQVLPHAQAAGVKLAIEPLHPMYAGDRSAINTLAQATDMSISLQSEWVGVALDVYHVWWDPHLESEIARCGASGKLLAFHICDWKVNTTDLLNDRGLMGEGCIPVHQIRTWVNQTGFTGLEEVEIFSNHYWSMDQSEYLQKIKIAYQNSFQQNKSDI